MFGRVVRGMEHVDALTERDPANDRFQGDVVKEIKVEVGAMGGAPTTPVVTPTPSAPPVPVETPTPSITLGRDVIGILTETEISCVREELGTEAFDDLLAGAVLDGDVWFESFPFGCLKEETAIQLSVSLVAAAAGGLSLDSRKCLGEVYIDSNATALGFIFSRKFWLRKRE